jgi:8-oxo-dGTP pyrophosphatase MutT (NUDIX family)
MKRKYGSTFKTRDAGYWGTLASGVLVMARNTCRVLLQKRSADVEQGGTWGIFGGAVNSIGVKFDYPSTKEDYDWYESHPAEKEKVLKDTALKELQEESGYNGRVNLVEYHVFRDALAPFEYHDFVGTVDSEFNVSPLEMARWEQEETRWVSIDDLFNFESIFKGERLHPGFKASLGSLERYYKKNKCII